MATRNLTRDVEVDEGSYSRTYRGTKAALIAAGVAAPEHFDFRLNKRGRIIQQRHMHGGRQIIVQRDHDPKRKSSGEPNFKVREFFTAEEQEARNAADRAQATQRKCLAAIAELPASASAYKAELERDALWALGVPLCLAGKFKGGYRLSDASIEAIEEAVRSVAREIKAASVVFDRKQREREIAGYRAKAAEADPKFAAFLATIVSAA